MHLVIFFAGFSISSSFPMIISLVAKSAPDAAGAAIGLTKLAVPLGGMLLSFVISLLSRKVPLDLALLAVPIASLLGLVTIGAVALKMRAIHART
jgi:predicted MFS family arabinose efflux permease